MDGLYGIMKIMGGDSMEIQQIQRVVDAIVLNENGIYNTVYFYGDSNRMQVMLANIERVYTKYYPMAKVIRTDAESFCNKTIRNMREQIFQLNSSCMGFLTGCWKMVAELLLPALCQVQASTSLHHEFAHSWMEVYHFG